MKKNQIVGLLNVSLLLISLACGSPTVTISRRDGADTNRKSEFLTAGNKQEMTRQIVDKFKTSDFYQSASAQNILKIKKGTIANRTGELISTTNIMDDITNLFVDDSVAFVEIMNDTASTIQAEKEVEFQNQRGAVKSSPKVQYDYLLKGALTLERSQILTDQDIRAEKIDVQKTYRLSMEIIDLRLNKVAWNGRHEVTTIKKTD